MPQEHQDILADGSSCPLPQKRSLGIAGRIWLSFSLLIVGYTIIILQGAWMASYTEEKNHLVSAYLFPAAITAQALLSDYKEQARQCEEAVLSGDAEQLALAKEKTAQIKEQLYILRRNEMVPEAIHNHVEATLGQYEQFLLLAMPIYQRMLTFSPDESLLSQAVFVRQQSQQLLTDITGLGNELASEMQTQFQAINLQSRWHKEIGILVFVGTVGLSIMLVAFMLSRSIIRPLRETVELANFMARGDLSRKLTIRSHDEFGELAKAMNIMAGELERYYGDMKGKVRSRTRRLEQVNKQLLLEAEQRKRTQRELVKALEAAQSSDQAKSAFLANMSHEIRTPMNGIIGMSSLLAASELTGSQQRYTFTIKNSAEALLQIINDILDFSKVEAGKLELEKSIFDPHETLADIVEIFAVQAQEKGLNLFTLLDSAVPTALHGDEGRLRQILLNLVGNAIKFTKDGEVAIRVKVEEIHGQQVTIRFAISDTGIGIPRQNMERLFAPFTQADVSTTRRFGGTGLGLSICQRLVALMGGEIQAESNEAVGSTFWFTAKFDLPAGEVEAVGQGPVTGALLYVESGHAPQRRLPKTTNYSPHPRLRDKKILIADDDSTNIIVTEAILESLGCQSRAVANGQEAVAAVTKHDFDLVLMDSQMPILSGIEATVAIRHLRTSQDPLLMKRSKVPIIALTADAVVGARQRYLQAGMDDYLSKPIRPETLHDCLVRWLAPSEKTALIFSRQRLLQRLGGDEEELQNILRQALADIPAHLAAFKKACINHDYRLLLEPCQAIKDIAVNLGVAALQHQAIHLCLAAADNKCEMVLFKEFEDGLDELVQILTNEL